MPVDPLVRNRSRRLLVYAVALAVALPVIYSALVDLAVSRWQREDTIASLCRAAAYRPGDAELWWLLALHYERDPVNRNLSTAEACLKRATRLDPSWPRYWAELGRVSEAEGNMGAAHEDYRRASRAGPMLPDVAWLYGSFLLRQGDPVDAAAEVRLALSGAPELIPSAISEFSNAGVGTNLILDRVVPARTKAYLPALDYFVARKEDDAAMACWERLAGPGQHVPLSDSLGLVDDLIAENRIPDAVRVWRQALRLAGPPSQMGAGGSLMYNGGFEGDLVNGGFGWRQSPADGTAFDLVSDVTHWGQQAGRVVFDGTANVDYSNLLQYVALDPGARYRFTAYMRTDSITTDTGPCFQLEDCASPSQIVAETPALTGTHPWTEVETEFTARPDLGCVIVALRRRPSSMIANKISGTVWVDDVRLERLEAKGNGGPRR